VSAKTSQDADASNEGNKAVATGGKATTLSNNEAGGGTGGAVSGNANTATGGTGGTANGGTTAERTAGDLTKSVGDLDPVTASASFSASGDPCKQIIKNATGVMAINGVNDIKGSVLQNATAQFGNAANNSINLGDAVRSLGMSPAYEAYKGSVNLNINPNNNQNTNIITIAPGQ
jgi:hypothetical protein